MHGQISDKHFVTYKMLSILKWTVEQTQLQVTKTQQDGGEVRYEAVMGAATKMRVSGQPY